MKGKEMDCLWDGQHLSPHPELFLDVPKELESKLKQGSSNTQYLDALAELALLPNWTETIFATFEPLFIELCTRWLQQLDSRYSALSVVSALAKLLPVAPHLSQYCDVIACKRKVGAFGLLGSQDVTALRNLPDSTLNHLLGTILRLIEFDAHSFEPLVPLAQIQVLLQHESACVRYLSTRIFCRFMCFSDSVFQEMIDQRMHGEEPHGAWETKSINYRLYPLWESNRLNSLRELLKRPAEWSIENSPSRTIGLEDLSIETTSFAGVLVPCIDPAPKSVPLVMTPTSTQNMRLVAEAIKTSHPVLITGVMGCGKTSIVRHIAHKLNHLNSMVTLHLNEQTDAKSLLGMYMSANKPGSFKWQPGLLTTAVLQGRWVFIEDLDRASSEVMGLLLPPLDRNEILVPQLGGWIRPAQGFRLLGTIRSSLNSRGEEIETGSSMLGARHWRTVSLSTLIEDDLREIIRVKYPILVAYEPSIMNIYRALRNRNEYSSERLEAYVPPGTQNLLRYCSRLEKVLTKAGIQETDQPVPVSIHDDMFLEAVDCFLGPCRGPSAKLFLSSIIASGMNFPPERAKFIISRVPQLSLDDRSVSVGRASLLKKVNSAQGSKRTTRRPFAVTDHTLRHMESLALAIDSKEPCLLVGETGTGKTTIVQELAHSLGHTLTVVNLSQQSEASDLIGGYKPVNVRATAIPMYEELEDLFYNTSSSPGIEQFMESLKRSINKADWARTILLFKRAIKNVQDSFSPTEITVANPKKRRKVDKPKYKKLREQWDDFAEKVEIFKRYSDHDGKGFAFSFVEGNIVKAVRSGSWILLDEINLAPSDTLETLADLFVTTDGVKPSILLAETGNIQRIDAHPDFRIFGAMNPATDVGKRDLPPSIRSRFTEYYIESPDQDTQSLKQIVKTYIGNFCHGDQKALDDVANLYTAIKELENKNSLVDGADQKPHFSLRTLTRTLTYVTDIVRMYGLRRALFEGFSMGFLTCLSTSSISLVRRLIDQHLLDGHKNVRAMLHQAPKPPQNKDEYIEIDHYWMPRGSFPIEKQDHYIITNFVKMNLLNLVRATSTRRYPVLLQGPTSSGKTSIVEYLAKESGNRFVRINNHEHTDLQEYLGTYISGPDGLKYQEGILVRALREGHWIVLDELNLAPTDVLEALNRLLDDNRELLIPETQEVVRPHPNFMLFATQNPPGLYGGRKMLSRAFRNRFLELHFDDIPEKELETILFERTKIAETWATRIVSVYKRLAILRQSNRIFEHKNSFATLRDLFRWALRDAPTREELAVNGFLLLAERVRDPDERLAVQNIIEDVMKVKIQPEKLYSPVGMTKLTGFDEQSFTSSLVWTSSTRRLFILMYQALKNKEPVLLVGGTGIGKTSICQVLAQMQGTELHILNAHQNTETGDLIGSQRPVRNRSSLDGVLRSNLISILETVDPSERYDGVDVESMLQTYRALPKDNIETHLGDLISSIEEAIQKRNILFEWTDGSLVRAMKAGSFFLLDEISLADDSVLERLNSVLEPERTLLLAEKGHEGALVKASEDFSFLATMNPGGDYGKKELSPALRNRFTEIWVPNLSRTDIFDVTHSKMGVSKAKFTEPMIQFASWFGRTFRDDSSISLREMLSWIDFVHSAPAQETFYMLLHGAAMVYIDSLGANPSATRNISEDSILQSRQQCLSELNKLFDHDMTGIYYDKLQLSVTNESVSLGSLHVARRNEAPVNDIGFSLAAETTKKNAFRILRALQVDKPILIEGSPGVGKTALVVAIASLVAVPLTRINLSDQTDVMDLFGSDVPVENGAAGQFQWSDAPFLQAMKSGGWVLLDEMNLASQSVLEGLNACIDHRGEVYVPELDQTFHKHPDFRLFAAQNPHSQGGGRKGLPASFVNRFTVVYADTLKPQDLIDICSKLYPTLPQNNIEFMVKSVARLRTITSSDGHMAMKGGPWDFNLRDILRWLCLTGSNESLLSSAVFSDVWDLLFLQRLREPNDIQKVRHAMNSVSQTRTSSHNYFQNLSKRWYQCGFGLLPVNAHTRTPFPQSLWCGGGLLESTMIAVEKNWPCLLVGVSGTGKTTLLHHLASTVGANLVELPLNGESDTMDLLGGYEQVDKQQRLEKFLRRLKAKLREIMSEIVTTSTNNEELTNLISVFQLVKASKIDELENSLVKIRSIKDNDSISKLQEELYDIKNSLTRDDRARFEWIDGALVESVEQGHWLVLDNANLCGPSVLDRLNSLLEPNGILALNERRNIDGTSRIIRPHPNFRLFLTMDPRYGEVSRAMRNRCVEMHFPSVQSLNTNRSYLLGDCYSFRLQMFHSFDWENLPLNVVRALLLVTFQSLSFSDILQVHNWLEALKLRLSPTLSKLHESLADIVHVLKRIRQMDLAILEKIQAIYFQLGEKMGLKSLALTDFVQSQTIHPLNNGPFISQLQVDTQTKRKMFCYGEFLDEKMDLLVLESSLLRASDSIESADPQKLTRLQRSVLSQRHLPFAKDSTQPLQEFFKNVIESMHNFLETNLDTVMTYSEGSIVHEISSYLRDIFGISTAVGFEEAEFQTLLIIGRSLSENARQHNLIKGLGDSLRNSLDLFNSAWGLSTGLSMELLWNSFRPKVPVSLSHLKEMEDYENLSACFDELIMNSNAPVSALTTLRTSLVAGFDTVIRGGSQETLGTVAEALQEERDSQSALGWHRYRHFHAEFEGLRQYLALTSNQASIDGKLLLLANQKTGIQLQSMRNSTSSNRGLLELPNVAGLGSGDAYLYPIRQILPTRVLQKLNNLSNVTLGAMDTVNEEIIELSARVANLTKTLCGEHLAKLNSKLKTLCLETFSYHGHLIETSFVSHLTQNVKDREPPYIPPMAEIKSHMSNDSTALNFKSIAAQFMLPSLACLSSLEVSNSPDVASSAVSWVEFFTAMLLLYVPDKIFDPALISNIRSRQWSQRIEDWYTQLAALELHEKHATGCETNLRIELVHERIENFNKKPEHIEIFRPSKSRLSNLQGEFNILLTSVLHRLAATGGISAILDGAYTGDTEIHFLRENIQRIRERLSSQYPEYSDVTTPAVAMLGGLEIGLTLSLIGTQASSPTDRPPTNGELEFHGTHKTFLGLHSNSIISHYLCSSDLTTVKLLRLQQSIIEQRVNLLVGDPELIGTQDLFDSLYAVWKGQLQSDQEKFAASSSLYRYRGSHADTEKVEQEDFRQLFPDFDSAAVEPVTEKIDVQKLSREVAFLHQGLLSNECSIHDLIIKLTQNLSREYARSISLTGNSSCPIPNASMLPSLILNLSDARSGMQTRSISKMTYNFYSDANLPESSKLLRLVERIQLRFRDLRAQWPEHVTLHDVLRCVLEIRDFRHVDPLAKILTKVEKLHGHIHEWQVVASSEFSAINLYNEVTNLLINWRRIELSTWSKLLDIEDEKCQEDSKSWWFIAYEAIIRGAHAIDLDDSNIGAHTQELLTQLKTFLESTSVAQFVARMDLIEIFSNNLLLLSAESKLTKFIAIAIGSFVQFYRRFQPAIQAHLSSSRSKIEQDLKEIVLLASWKDTNITALRESAKRSHHKLFKVVRKYRTILAEPVEKILRIPSSEETTKAATIQQLPETALSHEVDLTSFQVCRDSIEGWDRQASRYRDTLSTAEIMKRYYVHQESFDCSSHLTSFFTNLVDVIQSLRKETPTALTSENTELVKHLKSRKRKVLSETLKDLRRMGFRSNVDQDTIKRQKDLPSILTRIVPEPMNQDAQSALFSMLDYVGSIRQQSHSHSEELTSSDVARSTGVFESILNAILSQDRVIIQQICDLRDFDERLNIFANLWCPTRYEATNQRNDNFKTLKVQSKHLIWLRGILLASLAVLNAQIEMGNQHLAVLSTKLQSAADEAGRIHDELKACPELPIGLSSDIHSAVYQRKLLFMSNLLEQLGEWSREFSDAEYLLKHIKSWTNTEDVVSDANNVGNNASLISVSKLQEDVSNFIDSMLVGMQNLKATLDNSIQSQDEHDWLTRSFINDTRALSAMRLPKIKEKLQDMLCRLPEFNNYDLRIARALCATMLPILVQYRQAYYNNLSRVLQSHTSLCRLGHVLARSLSELLKSGFCSPQERSNDTSASEKLEDGTGLGEGEGAEDISKDVQDDEDLSELAQQENQNDGNDLQDEDNAVDMGTDELKGEDGEAVDKSDNGDDQSESPGDEIDEEVGSVDDLDPSAVDEKMWDAERDDDKKEKQGDKADGKKGNDLTADNNESQTPEDGEEEIDNAGAEENEEVQQEGEQLDPHTTNEQNLDLPDDMNMDDEGVPSDMDSDEDALDDMSQMSINDAAEDVEEEEGDGSLEDMYNKEMELDDAKDKENDDEVASVDQLPTEDNEKINGEENINQNQDQSTGNGFEGDNRPQSHTEMEVEDSNENPESTTNNRDVDNQDYSASESKTAGTDSQHGQHNSNSNDVNNSKGKQEEDNQNSHEAFEQPFQKLGNALETWHRLNKQIQNASQNPAEQRTEVIDTENADQEFEHLPDDDALADAQALGEATDEQAQVLEKEAMGSEKQQLPQNFPMDEDAMDVDRNQDLEEPELANRDERVTDVTHQSRISDTKRQDPALPEENSLDQDNEDDLNDLDNGLSVVHLDQDQPDFSLSANEAQRLWAHYESITRDLALSLTEQLRLILEPTQASKMRGDFRTGKRLNIKRIIPYIASQYKRDKIYMRRSVPAKRNYQVMLALDNSKSMRDNDCSRLALATLVLVSRSLTMLEAGKICVVGFGSDVKVAHNFDQPFSSEAGATALRSFGFQQPSTDVQKLIQKALEIFREARAGSTRFDSWQLQLIISDGICEQHDSIRKLLRQAHEERIMVVFVIIDSLNDQSILEMKTATFETQNSGETKLTMNRYIESFPFGYHLVVRKVNELPHVLATALRQWFAEVVNSA